MPEIHSPPSSIPEPQRLSKSARQPVDTSVLKARELITRLRNAHANLLGVRQRLHSLPETKHVPSPPTYIPEPDFEQSPPLPASPQTVSSGDETTGSSASELEQRSVPSERTSLKSPRKRKKEKESNKEKNCRYK